MKKIILFFSLFLGIAVFSQEATDTTTTQETVFEDADSIAEFPGGINEFRRRFTEKFDSDKLKYAKGKISTEITFVVERDGTISNIAAKGTNTILNEVAVKAIKKIKEKWNPAEYKGEKVRYRFKLPLTMSFE